MDSMMDTLDASLFSSYIFKEQGMAPLKPEKPTLFFIPGYNPHKGKSRIKTATNKRYNPETRRYSRLNGLTCQKRKVYAQQPGYRAVHAHGHDAYRFC